MLELRVLTGLHQGAVLPLIEGDVTIGASEEDDLTMFDSDISPNHLTFSFDGVLCVVSEINGEVFNLTNHLLCSGDNINLEDPFRLGNTWFMYVDSDVPWFNDGTDDFSHVNFNSNHKDTNNKEDKVLNRKFLWSFFGSLIFVLLIVFTSVSLFFDSDYAEIKVKNSTLSLSYESSLLKLTQMIEARELSTYLSISGDGDSAITISGRLSDTQNDVVNRMLARYKHYYKSIIPINNMVQVTEQGLPFEIIRIVKGLIPHVVIEGGESLFLGDEKEGLRLVSIEDHKVIFDGMNRTEVSW